MGCRNLPSDSEDLLSDLVFAEDPVLVLNSYYEGLSIQEKSVLDSYIRDLKQAGYIEVRWMDNKPWSVTLNNSAMIHVQSYEHEKQCDVHTEPDTDDHHVIFISHRSTDKEVAEMLVDFLIYTGIPRDCVFCSSLPGNDVKEKISDEIKTALRNSVINIAILSHDYYDSAYCLNEAGVLWYADLPVIPIALPEINSDNMYGFLNNNYKLRRLDVISDVSYIYDEIRNALSTPFVSGTTLTNGIMKLNSRYLAHIESRVTPQATSESSKNIILSGITTDDERIILYYMLQKKVRKMTVIDVVRWMGENEIHDVNLTNGFELLASLEGGNFDGYTLELGLETYREFIANATNLLSLLKKCMDQHRRSAADIFKTIWDSDDMDSVMKLFVAYIVDEKVQSFTDRWKAEEQIQSIVDWEERNALSPTLSSNYDRCLKFLYQNHLIYACDWTRYGNPKEYSLYPSLQNFLFDYPSEIATELQRVKSHFQH